MKWFNNPETLEDLKKQYKKLAFQNHPDRGGKTSDMQEINAVLPAEGYPQKRRGRVLHGTDGHDRDGHGVHGHHRKADSHGGHRDRGVRFLGVGHWRHKAAQGRAESPVFPVEQQQIRVVFPPRRIQEAEQEVSDTGRDQGLLRQRKD